MQKAKLGSRRGRRWRPEELAGKQKAEQVMLWLIAHQGENPGKPTVSIDKVLHRHGLKTPFERWPWRKAYDRWRSRLLQE